MNDLALDRSVRSPSNGGDDLCATLNALLADTLVLYLKTKSFHWHMSGPYFRDYHLMFDDHASQIFAMTDVLAGRVRKLGGMTLRSVGDIQRHGRIGEEHAQTIAAAAMFEQLRRDNLEFAGWLREAHGQCSERGDVASTSLLETFIDEVEQRIWFLSEAA